MAASVLAVATLVLVLLPTALPFDPGELEQQKTGGSSTPPSATTAADTAVWSPPYLPIADLFFSPCTFPLNAAPFVRHSKNHQHRHRQHHSNSHGNNNQGDTAASSICHLNRHIPFVCDLHRALSPSEYDLHSLGQLYHKYRRVLRNQEDGSASFVVVIVRQLIQPSSPHFVTENSTEFGCLFRLPCEPMDPQMVQRFVKSTKVFTKLYASALFSRWQQVSNGGEDGGPGDHRPPSLECEQQKVLALVLLDGVVSNPKRVTSVNLYTENQQLMPFIANTQAECTNMLLQGMPLADVLKELTKEVGHALIEFHHTKGQPRRHDVPLWAWALSLSAIALILAALFAEWIVVRRVKSRKFRSTELGGFKAVIKSKTHIIF